MPKTLDLTGQQFGRLTVVKKVAPSKWECICSCGNTTIATTSILRTGGKQSCGCLHKENRERMRNNWRIK